MNSSKIFKVIFIIWFIFTLFLFLAPFPFFSHSVFSKSDKISHIIITFLTALLFYLSFKEFGWFVPFFFTILYGSIVEVTQSFLPFRSFSIFDFIADIVGATGFLVFYFLNKNFLSNSEKSRL